MATLGQVPDDWINAWIEGQKATVQRWLEDQHIKTEPGAPSSFADWFQQAAAAAQAASGWNGAGGQMAALWGVLGASSSARAQSGWSLPDVGPLREQQATMKGLAAAVADYQRLAIDMASMLAKVHADTLDLLARRAAEQANAGTPVDSFKALYDLWIECGETTYARVAQGDAYVRLQADLCNAAIRVQSHQQQQLERWLKQVDLPTRSELNTLHRRVADLKRQIESRSEAAPSPAAPRKSRAPAKRKPAKKS